MQTKQQEQTLITWLLLLRAPRLGARGMLKILRQFPTFDDILHNLRELSDLNSETIAYLENPDWQNVEAELIWLSASKQHHIITFNDDPYPSLLREISTPPPILFLKGDINCINKPQIAVVGSRHPTPNGIEIARSFAAELANHGLTITSGLALGIDTVAHEGSLLVKQPTIAVLGTGFDHIYPKKNLALSQQIVEKGALLTEFPFGSAIKPENFPRRNRIISGLCLGTLIVEATLKSGSLITAKYAAEQGREVFAIPGSIFNLRSRGCHALIKQGAKLVESVADILEELTAFTSFLPSIQSSTVAKPQQNMLDEAHRKLLECVGFEPTTIENIVIRSGLAVAEVNAELIELELLGYIQYSLGGYSRVHL